MFDLTANPSLDERRRMARERPLIAADASQGGFNGVFIPKQPVAPDARDLIAIVCRHRHVRLVQALKCANDLGQQLIDAGLAEVKP
jgi:hypothetical protein